MTGQEFVGLKHHFFSLWLKAFNTSFLCSLNLWIGTLLTWPVVFKWVNVHWLKPSQSGRVVYIAMVVARTVVGSSPGLDRTSTNSCRHICISGSKRLGCHADLYTVSRCHTRGESENHTSEKACKGSTLALKPRADVTRSPKQGYQWPHKKDLCPTKILLKKKFTDYLLMFKVNSITDPIQWLPSL